MATLIAFWVALVILVVCWWFYLWSELERAEHEARMSKLRNDLWTRRK